MPYVSPIKLLKDFKLPVEPRLDRDTMRLARQALLAEIDLSPIHSVTLNGINMTRDEVLKLFDNMQADGALLYHEAIHQDPQLLVFFTEGKLPNKPLAHNPIYQDPGFVAFISTFYPEIFADAFGKILKTPTFEALESLFNLPEKWREGGTQREINRLIIGVVTKNTQALEHTLKSGRVKRTLFKSHRRNISLFYDHSLIDALNRLPFQFEPVRTHYAIRLVELAYQFWNAGNKDESHYIIKRVELIAASSNLQQHIDHYWSQCLHAMPPRKGFDIGFGQRGCGFYIMLYIGFRFLMAILKLIFSAL